MTDLFTALLHHSIPAGWIVLTVVVLRLLLHRAPKWITMVLWALVAIRLVLPVSFESGLSLMPDVSSAGFLPGNSVLSGTYVGGGYVVGGVTPDTPAASGQSWLPIFTAVWAIGVVILLAAMVISWLRLHRKLREAIYLQDGIYLTEQAASPFVFGLLRPRIYLPYGISEENRRFVIAHEKAHIRRRDHWWKPLGFLLLAVHWFHPLLWLAYILLCRDIEFACDEKVIRQLDSLSRADYSQALLTVGISRRSITVCPLAFGEAGVKERVKAVLHYKKPAFWIILIAILACIIAALCLLTDPPSESEASESTTPMATEPNSTAPLPESTGDPASTEPTHNNEWLNEHQQTADAQAHYPPGLIYAVDTQLQGYIRDTVPDGILRTFSYQIFSHEIVSVNDPNNPAKCCTVKLLVMFKDYAILGNGIGDIREKEETLVPVKLTLGIADGSYYPVDFWTSENGTEIRQVLPELASEILSPDENCTEALRALCEEKLQDYLRDQVPVLPDTVGNSMDLLSYDMDGDGTPEEYYLGSLAGGDVFTFLVGVRRGDQPLYHGVFSSSTGKLHFESDGDGVLVCCQPADGSATIAYRVLIEDNAIVLQKQ